MLKHRTEAAIAFAATFSLFALARTMSGTAIILADRFWAGAGWFQIALLSAYAAFVADRLMDPALAPRWRLRIWLLFSIVFFSQLLLGLVGFEMFLMTGKLHLPIPAVIVGGPLYRGGGLFMPILFSASMIVLGPAWCSYLCYFGSWDALASRARRRPGKFIASRRYVRAAILASVLLAAPGMGLLGVPPLAATWVAASFGGVGIAVMILVSRRTGVMAHCVTFCPMGLVANVAGRISPFRIAISEGCSSCMVCGQACRYEALGAAEIEARKPGLSCTLCGDCVSSCRHASIGYRFLGLGPQAARRLFMVTASVMHALFLGIAMI